MATVTPFARRGNAIATGNALELEGVTRYFGALRAMEDVSSRSRGRAPAVIGANGAGKTTSSML